MFRLNLESSQSEASSLIKRLKDSEKKVETSSVEDIKLQYLTSIQVRSFVIFINDSERSKKL